MKKLLLVALASALLVPASAVANHGTIGHWKPDQEYTRCDTTGGDFATGLAPRAEIILWDSTTASWRDMGVVSDAVDYYDDRLPKVCINIVLKSNTQTVRQNCAHAQGHVRLCNGQWSGVDHSVLDAFLGSGHMDNWDMRIRYDDSPGEIEPTYANRRYFVCHEIGHVIGLDHEPNDLSSCVNNSSDSQFPSAHDISTLNSLYSHSH